MIFSSILFLYLFFPLVLVLYFSVGFKFRNLALLVASLLFYAWGELGYVYVMLVSICLNWLLGLWIEKTKGDRKISQLVVGISIALNLIPLGFFKYANFFTQNINKILSLLAIGPIELAPIHLPIGISFFTFHAISYLVDIYRGKAEVQRRLDNLALYISFFPQLIAGPIIRYSDVAHQLVRRTVSLADFRYGIQRFIIGIGKKILIANTIGAVADQIFTLPSQMLPAGLLWLGMLTYTLQIYYDFSGYSDMAIGMARMFGFHFRENFNHPYCASSVQEFWRRWHISLSTWFRDYLYIPLGGNRKGNARTYLHLLTVFFLCGLWHGASWNFIVWGLFHGTFLALERTQFGTLLSRLPRIFQHCYTILVFMVGWVFFRADSLGKALDFLAGFWRFSTPPYLNAELFAALNTQFYIALIVGIILSFPVMPFILSHWNRFCETKDSSLRRLLLICNTLMPMAWMAFIIIYCSAQLISGTHNPFLYFRF